jgi:hypothetical protein
MHGLIRLILITLGRRARAQECEKSIVKFQLHELFYRQSTVAETKAALRGITDVLYTMTCEVNYVRGSRGGSCVHNSG